MTETTETTAPKQHNAKDILVEAMDTVRATYWIQGEETNFATGVYIGSGAWDWSGWNEIEKAIPAALDEGYAVSDGVKGPEGNKAKITGVCSIGALALANVTLYDEPLAPWMHIAERDFETWKAGQALAQEIVKQRPGYLDDSDAGTIIANWNDSPDRTREEVLDMFERATKSSLLAAETVYQIGYSTGWGFSSMHLYFATEEEAQRFLGTESELLTYIQDDAGDYELETKPYLHDSQAMA